MGLKFKNSFWGLAAILLIIVGTFFLFLYFTSLVSVSSLLSPSRYDSASIANEHQNFQKNLSDDSIVIQPQLLFNPSQVDLTYSSFDVKIKEDTLSGWYLKQPGTASTSTILILHDINESKITYLQYARTFFDLGFHICLVDLPAQGESDGEKFILNDTSLISTMLDSLFCFYETRHVSVLAVGVSSLLIVKSLEREKRVRVIVLQNPVNKLSDLLYNELRKKWSVFSDLIYPLAKMKYLRETGISIDSLNLSELIKRTNKPILISITDSATEMQAQNALTVYDSCASPLKKIWTSKSRSYVTNMFDVENNYFRAVAAFINSNIPKEKNTKRNKKKIAVLKGN